MLRRTSVSQWFNEPFIELTEYESPEVILAFPEEHKGAIHRLEDMDKQQEAEDKREWEDKTPGQIYQRVLNQCS